MGNETVELCPSQYGEFRCQLELGHKDKKHIDLGTPEEPRSISWTDAALVRIMKEREAERVQAGSL
jgi:hypothetical protein